VPEKGVNPNYALATFLGRLAERKSALKAHELLGATSVAPTIIEVDTKSSNVTPAWTRVLLDFRTAAESPDSLQAFVNELAGDWPHALSDAWVADPNAPLQDSDETIYGYYTPPEHDVVTRSLAAITEGMGWQPDLTSYNFATDGRHFVPYNFPIIGYSPAEEHLAHTIKESISIAMMADSLRGHVALIKQF
jgi:acetylornithine deacetylase/succinyl-diaminopimelate desuccinylase-like protein